MILQPLLWFICLLYTQHLCRGVYSFCLSVRMFVRSFVTPSHMSNLRQSFACKFLKWGISHEPLIRKHSYLVHRYPGGLAFIPWLLTPGNNFCRKLVRHDSVLWHWLVGHEVKVSMIYISWSIDFALYLEDYLMYEHHSFRLWNSMTSK